MNNDIVSTLREILRKFIRELYRLTIYMKIMKLSNALTTPTAKYFANEEVAGLFKIFGYDGYKKKFDPDKFKPEKVVIATDADADGDHITFLVFTMFLRYLPFVIEQGKLYIANPPLYGTQIGKQKKFFANNIDYIEFVQNTFCKENTVCDLKNKPYSKKDIVKILYKNRYYVDELNKIAWTYSLDQYLLEFLLFNRKLDSNKLISAIKKEYKYVEATSVNNVLVLKVLAGGQIQTIFFTQRLFNDCAEIIKYIDKSEEYYLINGQKTSIYGLMSLFKKFEPKNLSRYKGLGEMPPEDLAVSTVLPGQGRSLKQYTIDDVKKELKYFTELQSDKSVFIKGIEIRKEDIV